VLTIQLPQTFTDWDFKKYKKVFDLSSFDMMKTPDSLFKGSYEMLNVKQLNHASDSIGNILTEIKGNRIQKEVNNYFTSAPIFLKGNDAGPLIKKIPSKAKELCIAFTGFCQNHVFFQSSG